MKMLSQDERVGLIMDFEGGEISQDNFLNLFSDLIKSGMCWNLQGFYGRTATNLIENNIIDKKGIIHKENIEN